MLRDVLTSIPGVETWPCDEINYIWRHGNIRYPSDEFTPQMATPRIRRYIRSRFDWAARHYKAHTVVEKTCANSLRVGFVNQVLPEARYIFIRRDGLDAVGSALLRWTAKLDIPYLARKARFVPALDLPYYACRYSWNRVYRVFSLDKRLAFWGPKLEGMDELLAKHTLEEVCALQWKRCVDSATKVFSKMPAERWISIAYEDFVREPRKELNRLIRFLDLEMDADRCPQAVAGVSAHSIGKGRNALGEETNQRLMSLIQDTMARYDYA